MVSVTLFEQLLLMTQDVRSPYFLSIDDEGLLASFACIAPFHENSVEVTVVIREWRNGTILLTHTTIGYISYLQLHPLSTHTSTAYTLNRLVFIPSLVMLYSEYYSLQYEYYYFILLRDRSIIPIQYSKYQYWELTGLTINVFQKSEYWYYT